MTQRPDKFFRSLLALITKVIRAISPVPADPKHFLISADALSMSNLRMLGQRPPRYLLASAEPALLGKAELTLTQSGAAVEIVLSAHALLAAIGRSELPDLLLLDTTLPGEEIERLLAAIREASESLPVILVAESVTEEWLDRMGAGVIDDLVLRSSGPAYWELRAERLLRTRGLEHELEKLREAATRDALHDRLTGVLNRDALLVALFRETDRVQRTNGSLSVILFDIDDFGHWNSRLGVHACDDLLYQAAARTAQLLRSYDVLGRTGKDEFLVGLPGCTPANAVMLAERLRGEVFAEPYHVSGEAIRLSACFGIAQSLGRSPVVVLREAEQALALARETGPESIQFGGSLGSAPPPVTFLSAASGEELLAW